MLAGMNIVSRAERNFHDGCVRRQCVPQYLAWPDVRINQHIKKLFIKIYYVKKTFPSNITKCPKFGNRKPVVIDHFECLLRTVAEPPRRMSLTDLALSAFGAVPSTSKVRIDKLQPVPLFDDRTGVRPRVNKTAVQLHDKIRICFPKKMDNGFQTAVDRHMFGVIIQRNAYVVRFLHEFFYGRFTWRMLLRLFTGTDRAIRIGVDYRFLKAHAESMEMHQGACQPWFLSC